MAREKNKVSFLLISKEYRALIAFTLVLFLLSFLASLPTQGEAMEWYRALKKPTFTPPSYLFGIVWPALYIMMAIAVWKVWRLRHSENIAPALITFFLQLSVNLVWSYLFFGLRSPMFGFAWIVVLLPLIVLTMVQFDRHSRVAAKLLVPYLAWTFYALILAYNIWILN
jgi:tryptophan-rich sensory protein